jgi:acetylglutamate kinase
MERVVLKVGGNELDDAAFVDGLVDALRQLQSSRAVAVVHGGGKAIANLQERLHLEPRFVDGLRVTDDASLDVAEMVLSGWVNKRLVGRLVAEGIPSVGLSGVDGGLFRVVRMDHQQHNLGWVGQITGTDAKVVDALLDRGITPVVSPISLGLDGHTYNVNADHAAAALACALGAGELVFVSNVPGVLGECVAAGETGPAGKIGRPGECIPALTPAEVEEMIASGAIHGGMVPKVRSALQALEAGVPQVRITDLAGLCANGGTCFLQVPQRNPSP